MDHLNVPQTLGLLVVMLATAKLFGLLAQCIGQPAVLGELVAGVVRWSEHKEASREQGIIPTPSVSVQAAAGVAMDVGLGHLSGRCEMGGIDDRHCRRLDGVLGCASWYPN